MREWEKECLFFGVAKKGATHTEVETNPIHEANRRAASAYAPEDAAKRHVPLIIYESVIGKCTQQH